MTDFKTKVDILCGLVVATVNVPEWDNYKRANDLGLALAVAEQGKLATINSKGKEYVNQSYTMLLNVLGLSGEYATIDEIFEAAIANGADTA